MVSENFAENFVKNFQKLEGLNPSHKTDSNFAYVLEANCPLCDLRSILVVYCFFQIKRSSSFRVNNY